jgi:hypothetical protein
VRPWCPSDTACLAEAHREGGQPSGSRGKGALLVVAWDRREASGGEQVALMWDIFLGDARVGVNLLEHLVDVYRWDS